MTLSWRAPWSSTMATLPLRWSWPTSSVSSPSSTLWWASWSSTGQASPGGTTDEQLTLLGIRRRGKLRGGGVNYACHGVVMGPDNLTLSGDWIGLTRAALARKRPELFSLVAVAPSANINPMPATIRKEIATRGTGYFTNDPFSGIYDRTGGTFAEAEQMAGAIARSAVKGLGRAQSLSSSAGVSVTTATADIGRRPKTMRAPLRLIRVGQIVFVGMPGEQFVETGTRVKRIACDEGLVPILLTHSPRLGYVPTPEAFAQNGHDDYEVDRARRMGMAEDAADREVAAVRRGLRSLTSSS